MCHNMELSHASLVLLTLPHFLVYATDIRSTATVGINQRKYAHIDGDFIIGAIFPVHDSPQMNGSKNPLLCGQINEKYGIQRVETALDTIDIINKQNILSGIKLGINIRDDCLSEPIALYQTMNLIDTPTPWSKCTDNSDLKRLGFADKPLIGIIGPSSSTTTIHVQNFLKLFRIPQVSYTATATTLFNFEAYPYFLSVIPADVYQTTVMLQIIKKYNWSYISIVYTDNAYGQGGMNDLKRKAHEHNVCIAKSIPIPPYITEEMHYDTAVGHLLEDQNAKVVVCFCDVNTARNLLSSVKRMNVTGKFLFMGSDLWSTKQEVVKDFEEEAWGNINIDVSTRIPRPLQRKFDSRNLTNFRNPWFQEYWEYKFDCKVNPPDNTTRRCTGEEKLANQYEDDHKLFYVVKAIYTFAMGLSQMRDAVCKDEYGLCSKLLPFNSTKFLEHIRNTSFDFYYYTGDNTTSGMNQKNFSYDVYNFQKLENGSFQYVKIGSYNGYSTGERQNSLDKMVFEEGFDQNVTVQFLNGTNEPIGSNCSVPCGMGQKQARYTDDPERECCWTCANCERNETLFNKTTCLVCEKGFWPNPNKTECYQLPIIYTQWDDLQSLISLPFCVVGIIFTLITSYIFFKYRETPVVKSSTRELCYLMLISMIFAYSSVFLLISKPTLITCTLVRLVPPISFTAIYASLLVKTNRIARLLAISKEKFPNLNPPFMTLKAQIVITSILIGAEIVICCVLLYSEPPVPYMKYNEPYDVQLHCPTSLQIVITPFIFVVLLVLMCTVYAVKTRNLPGNFNEAKFIGFAMYTTCITWTAFILVYYGSDFHVISMCLCASINSLVVLIFLFFPKLYIILWVPERNTRANFTTTNGIRCIIGREEMQQNYPNKMLFYENDFVHISELNVHRRKSVFTQTDEKEENHLIRVVQINEWENGKEKLN